MQFHTYWHTFWHIKEPVLCSNLRFTDHSHRSHCLTSWPLLWRSSGVFIFYSCIRLFYFPKFLIRMMWMFSNACGTCVMLEEEDSASPWHCSSPSHNTFDGSPLLPPRFQPVWKVWENESRRGCQALPDRKRGAGAREGWDPKCASDPATGEERAEGGVKDRSWWDGVKQNWLYCDTIKMHKWFWNHYLANRPDLENFFTGIWSVLTVSCSVSYPDLCY